MEVDIAGEGRRGGSGIEGRAAPVVLRHGRGVREKRRDEGTPKVVVASSVGGGGVRCNGGGSRRSSDSGEGVRCWRSLQKFKISYVSPRSIYGVI